MTMRPDPTFHASPKLAMEAPPESFAYTLLLSPDFSKPDALAVVDEIHAALDRLGLTAPRLQHGDGEATWVLLRDAIRRGIDTRIGLEDTVAGPDAARTDANVALVRAARVLGAGS